MVTFSLSSFAPEVDGSVGEPKADIIMQRVLVEKRDFLLFNFFNGNDSNIFGLPVLKFHFF